jgi:hypothetical protein
MPLTLRSKKTVAYNPNLAGRAGRYSQPKDDSVLNGATTRSKRLKEHDSAERCSRIKLLVPTAPATPVKEDLLMLERATRGANPTCLHFGIDTDARRARYPDYFFCSNCDRWANDYLISFNRNQMKRESRTYKCTASHTNFITPTTKKKHHHTLNFDETASDSDDSDSDRNNVPSPPDVQRIPSNLQAQLAVTPEAGDQNQIHPQQLRYDGGSVSLPDSMQANNADLIRYEDGGNVSSPDSMQANNADLISENTECPAANTNSLQAELAQLHRKYGSLLERHQDLLKRQSESPKELTIQAIKSVPNKSKDLEKKKQKQVEHFVSFIMDSSFFDGLVRKEILRRVNTHLREDVFSPWALLKEMDNQGHKLSLQAVEVVRAIQVRSQKYSRDCVLPSSTSIQRVAAIVEAYAKPRIPYTIANLPQDLGGGEIISFDDAAVIRMLLGASGLLEAAKRRRITIPTSCDTTVVTKNCHFMLAGIKINDRAACCPFTKLPLFIHQTATSKEESRIQSYKNCIPTTLIVAKETNEVIDFALKEKCLMYRQEDELSDTDTSIFLGEGYKPLHMPSNADMKMHWAGIAAGGAAKRVESPCHCCAIKSDDLVRPNSEKCSSFCQQWVADGKLQGRDDWRCFHKDLLSVEKLESIQDEVNDLREELGDLFSCEDVWGQSKLDCTSDPRLPSLTGQSDPVSIHFNLTSASRPDRVAYSNRLIHDLSLRELDFTGTSSQMQERLLQSLLLEHDLQLL